MNRRSRMKPWFYCLPALLLILIVLVFPILYTGYISLTNMTLSHWSDYRFIGLRNYARALWEQRSSGRRSIWSCRSASFFSLPWG